MATITPYDKIQVGQLRLPTLQEMMITPEYLAQKTEAVQTYATEIQSEAEKAKMFISAEDDNESKEYEGYIGKLTQASKNLAKSGMKGGDIASIKASLGEIKALYNKTILPIITAGQQRVADQNLLKELALKDNSLIFVPKSPTLTDYKNNNYASLLPEMVSGNAITQDVATEMSAFKDQPGQNKYNITPLKGIKYQYIYEIQRGLNPEQIKNISNPTKLKETLTPIEQTAREILDWTMDKFNIKSKFGENSLQYQQAWKAAVKGLVAGIGGTSSQIIKDDYAMATALKGEGPPIPPSPTSPYARTVLRPEINKGQLGKLQKLKEKIITTKTVEKKAADVMGDLYATANESNTPIALQSTPYAKAESREKIVKDAKDVGITTTFNNRDLSYDEIIKKIDKAIKESATLAVYNPIDFTVEQSQVAAKRLHSAFKNNKDTNVSNFFVMENGAVKGLNGQLYFSPMESKLYLSDKDGKNFIPIDAGNIDESLKTIFTQNRQYLNNILGLDLNNTSTGTALLKDLRGAAKEYVKSNLSTIISKFTQDFNSIPELRSKYKLSDYLAKQRDAYEEFVYNELLQQASNPGIINSPISDIINTLTLTTGSSSQKVANP